MGAPYGVREVPPVAHGGRGGGSESQKQHKGNHVRRWETADPGTVWTRPMGRGQSAIKKSSRWTRFPDALLQSSRHRGRR